MFLGYIWTYTIFIVILWAFFIIAKMHSYKFKMFSNNIQRVTTILIVILLSLSILGYITIIVWYDSGKSVSLDFKNNSNFSEIDY